MDDEPDDPEVVPAFDDQVDEPLDAVAPATSAAFASLRALATLRSKRCRVCRNSFRVGCLLPVASVTSTTARSLDWDTELAVTC